MYSHSHKIGRKQNSCTKMLSKLVQEMLSKLVQEMLSKLVQEMLSKLAQEKFEDSGNQRS